jgi:hypothetical protein
VTGNGHGEQVNVGDRPESGSILTEGGAAFVVWGGGRSGVGAAFDQSPDADGEVVMSDLSPSTR